MYKPKIIKGKVSGTGWPIDGHELYLSMWAYDNYGSWHLYSWEDEADEAVMMTMFRTEVEAGFISEEERESFVAKWKAHEWESPGVFTLDLDKVEVLEVIAEEEKDEAREKPRVPKVDISPRKDTDRGGFLCLPLAENLSGEDVQARHPEWERMKCPKCGRECWKPAGVEELREKQGVQLLCTMCALESGLVAPYRKHKEPKPGGNRAQRRREQRGKQR